MKLISSAWMCERVDGRSGERQMRVQAVLCIAALLGLLAAPQSEAINACPDAGSCAQVSIGSPTASPGTTVSIPVSFTQGPAGTGIGQVAAIAFTITMPNGAVVPLTLADCTPSAGDSNLPNAVQPSAALAGYKLVIENAYCSASRTHCLCPTDSTPPDSFINVVVYGPDPLPTPGAGAVVIPALPTGQTLFTLNLNVAATAAGTIPLHVLNQVDDSPSTRPAFTALLSVGDTTAVDETCGSNVPPCGDPGATSQVAITHGNILLSGGCIGNCDYSSQVTVDELLALVNIALGNTSITLCEAGDANASGTITVDEILTAINNALSGCH